MRCSRASPCSRLAMPARSPVGEWHLDTGAAKYLLARLGLPVCRSATSTPRRPPVSDRLRLLVVNEGDDGAEVASR